MAFGRPVTNEQAVALGLEDGSSGSASTPIPHQQAVQLGLEDGLPEPPSDSFIKGGIWTGGLKPLGQGIAALGSIAGQRGKEADAQLNAGGSWGGPEEKIIGDILGGMYNAQEAEWGKAFQAQREGRGLGEFMYRGLAGSIPILGPMLGKALDTGLAGRPKEAAGQAIIGAPLQFAAPEIAGELAGATGRGIAKASKSPITAGLKAGLGKAGIAAVAKEFPVIGPAARVGMEAYAKAKAGQLPPPPVEAPIEAPPATPSAPISSTPMQPAAELPRPPIGSEVTDFADWIKNNRRSNSNPSPWADPEVLQQEAVNAALDANKRVESQGAGMGSGFESGLDQPTPRWNPLVNKINDPLTGKPIQGTFDPRTGSVTPTLKAPPEFATFEPDELMGLADLQKRLKGKQVQGANTLGKPEANLAKLDRLTQQFGDKAAEGAVTPIASPEGGLYLVYKKGGKITDYALLEEGPEGVVLQERVRGGKADPGLSSPGMDQIKDALWGLRDKFKVNPSSMSEGALKSWMKYKPKPKAKK